MQPFNHHIYQIIFRHLLWMFQRHKEKPRLIFRLRQKRCPFIAFIRHLNSQITQPNKTFLQRKWYLLPRNTRIKISLGKPPKKTTILRILRRTHPSHNIHLEVIIDQPHTSLISYIPSKENTGLITSLYILLVEHNL